MVAVAAWQAGWPAGDGLRSRAAQAWSGLAGGGQPVLAMVRLQTLGARDMRQDRRLMLAVLAAQAEGLAAEAATRSGTAR
jgi:hypothetical protein